jgi:hypothetical protein
MMGGRGGGLLLLIRKFAASSISISFAFMQGLERRFWKKNRKAEKILEVSLFRIVAMEGVIQEGEAVILFSGKDYAKQVIIQKKATIQNKWGSFKLEELIGKKYGTKVG